MFWPYLRDPETLARPWAHARARPGLMHRIGGIEKEDGTGNISYDPANHERMVRLRAAKVAGIANDIPPVEVEGDVDDAELLRARLGVDLGRDRRRRRTGSGPGAGKVAHAHLAHLNPFPPNLGEVLPPLPEGARARDEPRPAQPAASGPSTSSTPGRSPRCRARRSPPASSSTPSSTTSEACVP